MAETMRNRRTQHLSLIIFGAICWVLPALFNPLRGRLQDLIDRRFYRSKYDAERALAGFAQTARSETNMDAITAELAATVQAAIQPESAAVWMIQEPHE